MLTKNWTNDCSSVLTMNSETLPTNGMRKKGWNAVEKTCPCPPLTRISELTLSGKSSVNSHATETPIEWPTIASAHSKPKALSTSSASSAWSRIEHLRSRFGSELRNSER